MKIEYTLDDVLRDSEDQFIDTSPPIPVVRLAEVETLIQEAEKFAKNVVRNGRWQEDEYVEAQGFLHRVAAWRKGQEGKA